MINISSPSSGNGNRSHYFPDRALLELHFDDALSFMNILRSLKFFQFEINFNLKTNRLIDIIEDPSSLCDCPPGHMDTAS